MIVIDIFGDDAEEIDTKKVEEDEALRKRRLYEEHYLRNQICPAPQLQIITVQT